MHTHFLLFWRLVQVHSISPFGMNWEVASWLTDGLLTASSFGGGSKRNQSVLEDANLFHEPCSWNQSSLTGPMEWCNAIVWVVRIQHRRFEYEPGNQYPEIGEQGYCNGSVGSTLVREPEDLSLSSTLMWKMSGMVMCACHQNTERTETGRSLWLAGQLG